MFSFGFKFFLFWLSAACVSGYSGRSRRTLIYPETAPTRVQMIVGIGVPLQDLKYESVTTGYVFKAQYFLPINATDWRPQYPFFPLELKRRFQRNLDYVDSGVDLETGVKYEKFDGNLKEVSESYNSSENNQLGYWYGHGNANDEYDVDSNDIDEIPWKPEIHSEKMDSTNARWNLYKGIERIAEKQGLNGRSCLLRGICEAAHVQFSHFNGILGELMHIVMSPSSSLEPVREHNDNEYLRAEQLGKEGIQCGNVFTDCKKSIIETFSGIYEPIIEIMKLIK